MASDQDFVEFVIEQIHIPATLTYKKMFGEYCIYADVKPFAFVCDNRLLVKPTDEGKAFAGKYLQEGQPYPGAKNYILVEEKLEDWQWLSQLVKITIEVLPLPKPKKKKQKN